jgi:DNA repair protein RecO (recombination protein O)
MLGLPPCLLGQGPAPDSEVLQALKTTGYFMHNKLATVLAAKPLPVARARFVEVFAAGI